MNPRQNAISSSAATALTKGSLRVGQLGNTERDGKARATVTEEYRGLRERQLHDLVMIERAGQREGPVGAASGH